MTKFYEIVTEAPNLVISGVPIRKGKIVELDPRQYTELVKSDIKLIEIKTNEEKEIIKAYETKIKELEKTNDSFITEIKTLRDSETKLKEEIKKLNAKG